MAEYSVLAPNGSKVVLRDKREANFFEHKMREYEEFKSEHPTDADILTQMIYLQTLNYRYMEFLSSLEDDEIPDIDKLNKIIKENTLAIATCADSLRLSKKYREESEGSVDAFLANLLKRAEIYKEKGIDRLADKAISNMKKIKTLLRLRKVCDAEEKLKMGISSDEQIFKLFENLIREFEELDEPLREEQKGWWLE